MIRLDLVAGPNGAGKSTFVELTLAPMLAGSVFVNADEIAKQRWPADPAAHAHDAALIAAETRAKLIELGRSFIAETVFSHPSKLELVDTARAKAIPVVTVTETISPDKDADGRRPLKEPQTDRTKPLIRRLLTRRRITVGPGFDSRQLHQTCRSECIFWPMHMAINKCGLARRVCRSWIGTQTTSPPTSGCCTGSTVA